MFTDTIPDIPTLSEFINWVRWKYNKEGKKPPLQVNGKPASPTDPRTWSSYEDVKYFDKIGFVFTKEAGITGIDIDNCRDPETGELSELAQDIISRFTWTWVEVSPSGTGIHILAGGSKPEWCTECKFEFPNGEAVEIYDHDHYFTFTGERIRDVYPFAIANRQEEIDALCYGLFWEKASEKKKKEERKREEKKSDATPLEELGLDDQEILDKLFSFSNGEMLRDLYKGNWEKWEEDCPSHSDADFIFCRNLGFLRCSRETIDRIVSSSGLYRDKWDRKDYKWNTIDNAIASVHEFYSGKGSKVNETIEKLYFSTLFHPFKFKNSVDPLVLSGILELAHNRGSYIKDGYLIVNTSQRDVTILRNIPQRTVSNSVNRLEEQGYFSVIDKGNKFIASTYAIPLSAPLKSLPFSMPESGDPLIENLTNCINKKTTNLVFPPDPPTPPTTVLSIMSTLVSFLCFNSLNFPLIRAILMIAVGDKISVKELKGLMGYTHPIKDFRNDVIHPLRRRRLINLDKKKQRFVKIREDWINNLLETFDEEEMKRVVEQVEEERRDRDERCLAKPLEEIRRDIEFMESMGWITA